MRPEVNDAVRHYARAVQREQASRELDSRVMRSIDAWAAPERRRSAESVFETRLFAVAAAVAVLMICAAYAAVVLAPSRDDAAVAAGDSETVPELARTLPAQDLWPAAGDVPVDAVVLRVPTAFTGAAAIVPAGGTVPDELRFWLDVRIASDGSMRVVRVVPADMSARRSQE